MRIAMVAPLVTAIREPQLGGSQALVADLATGLADRGHDVDLYAASGSAVEGVNVIDTGVDPESLQGSLFRSGQELSPDPRVHEAFSAVYDAVGRGSYDIVHNHAFDLPAIELSACLESAVVHTLHLPPESSVAHAIGSLRASHANVTSVCVSESSARGWSELLPVDAVLRNGVPVERIPWSPEPREGLLFAGRLSPEKGAAEAAEIASLSGRNLTVVGSPYDRDYAKRVASVGPLPRHELWELMATAEAVLCPVSWEEPFGLVAAEAQAAGTPVVAFDRGALGEVISHGRTGFLVGGVSEAVEALERVGRIDRRACRLHAEETLHLDRTIDAHESLYRRVTTGCAE
jgi:UDP-glucose:tetrahydrobiopterin glucosyltransferase